MPSSDLKTSIEKLGDSSTGVSPSGFTRLWGLDPFSGSGHVFYGNVTGTGIRMFMDVGSLGTSPSVENAHAMIARGLCHLVIERLPDAALAEVMESLKTLFEFYNTRRQQAIPL